MSKYIPTADSVGEIFYIPAGHYTVGNDVFYNNRDALEAGTQTNQDVNWHYFDDVWHTAHDRGLWKHLTLPQLYAQRARRLREEYDYVAVMFSGGWDSRNILETFEREGLHIDDIIIFSLPELENNSDFNDKSASNWSGEIPFHALPYAKQYIERHPGTGIIVVEWLSRTLQGFSNSETLWKDSKTRPGGMFGRYFATGLHPDVLRKTNGKKSCLLMGIDKPMIMQQGTRATGIFPSTLLSYYTNFNKSNGFPDNVMCEPFYWTPDLPELAIRGWYELLDLCKQDPTVSLGHTLTEKLEVHDDVRMSDYVQHAICRRLYPGFTPDAWHAKKQSEFGFFMEVDEPVFNLIKEHNPDASSILREVINELHNRIDEKYLRIGDKLHTGLVPWVDKTISDKNTVLGWKGFYKMFKLDTNFNLYSIK